ncbi:hypothetical protein LAUMK4_05631 [Mycobacterium persicum]|uniref:TniQ protein n=1 Tax=Mycobacterium persicum TaxID=1487726 RepID=A0ABY6RRY9_9MYCO|nr:hypothetical protein [Mycobacterium persicum]VBA31953.1 hypothetical protein LAUMK4_05631 [Mycobacterium persicum]
MKLWHLPAHPLPLVTRPIVGETRPSYTRRLAVANDLTPYAILRALGHLRTGPGKHLLTCDARINQQAAARLETYTGIPAERLAHAIPAMTRQMHHRDTLPTDRPALCFRRMQTRSPCRKCELSATGPTGPPALVLPGWTPIVCHRHRRWLGPSHDTTQHDLPAVPDVLVAGRRLTGLLARSGDRAWTWKEFQTACNIVWHWSDSAIERMPALAQRWHDRAAALGTTVLVTAPAKDRASPWIVTFPEAVALTAILTDLDLRRHIALEWDHEPLYQRISASIGEQSNPSWPGHNDPVRSWVRIHRARFEQLRYGAWCKPLPPPERFK